MKTTPAVGGFVTLSLTLALLVVGVAPVVADPAPSSLGLRAEYDVNATIHWSASSMEVVSVAHVKNTTDEAVNKLYFNLLPLRLGHLDQLAVTVNGTPVAPNVDDMTVIVPFSGPLVPGAGTDVSISYRAFFNTNASGKKALFMHTGDTIAAYRWIPWLSRVQAFATPNFGESWVTAVSPRVKVTFSSDVALKYATSGKQTSGSGTHQVFKATNVRDFNFAASPSFKVKTVTWNGIRIRALYRTYDPDSLLKWTLSALKRFTSKIGKYPYDHLDVAETPAGVGMESPAMTWIDSTLAKSRFPYIVVHETSHQWFYGAVGNNQASNPFVDEALADFLTRDLLGSFRKSDCGDKRLDMTVYKYGAWCYPEVIYVQGGLYLRDYRTVVGSDAFWKGLHRFYVDFKYRIANERDLLDALDAASGFDSALHAARFPGLYP